MQFNPYLNFDGNAREAFLFYKSVFGGDLAMMEVGSVPDGDQFPKEEQSRLMHVSLPLPNGQLLMASDIFPSMGQSLNQGNHNYISITVDSREQADYYFENLSFNGEIEMPLEDMFWGDYFGSFRDQFGVYWMISYENK